MQHIVLILVDAMVYGASLFLLCVGLALIFGVQQVLNVAHGGAFTFGAYAATTTVASALALNVAPGLQLVALALISIPVGLLLGLAIEYLVLMPLRRAESMVVLLGTYAAFLILEDTSKVIWGGVSRYANAPRDALGTVNVATVAYTTYDLLLVGLAFAIGLAISYFLNRTRVGRLVQAVSYDREISAAVGINHRAVFLATFCVGTILGVLAGAFTAPRIAVAPGIGVEIIIVAFAVVVIGGLGSILGAAIGSALVGLTKAVALHFMPAYELFAIYTVMVIVLAIRPHGLIGHREVRRI